MEGKGEDDLLLGRGGNIGGSILNDLPENESGLIVFARLEKGLAKLKKGLPGKIGAIANLLNLLLCFLHTPQFLGCWGSLTGNFCAQGSQLGFEQGDEFVPARNGAEADHGLRQATGGKIDRGELKVRLKGESGIWAVSDAGVDLRGPGESGLTFALFKIGQELAGALRFGVAL